MEIALRGGALVLAYQTVDGDGRGGVWVKLIVWHWSLGIKTSAIL